MVMVSEIHQGDVLKIENIRHPILVVSKDFFNETGHIIGCPIFTDSIEGALHVHVVADGINGFVHCEQLAFWDVNVRGYIKVGNIALEDKIDISDTIQGIFDYI
ncbi:MAG: type II toxin-antitoxin system PemK/MazF family toxin [Agathobacter sp.]